MTHSVHCTMQRLPQYNIVLLLSTIAGRVCKGICLLGRGGSTIKPILEEHTTITLQYNNTIILLVWNSLYINILSMRGYVVYTRVLHSTNTAYAYFWKTKTSNCKLRTQFQIFGMQQNQLADSQKDLVVSQTNINSCSVKYHSKCLTW